MNRRGKGEKKALKSKKATSAGVLGHNPQKPWRTGIDQQVITFALKEKSRGMGLRESQASLCQKRTKGTRLGTPGPRGEGPCRAIPLSRNFWDLGDVPMHMRGTRPFRGLRKRQQRSLNEGCKKGKKPKGERKIRVRTQGLPPSF